MYTNQSWAYHQLVNILLSHTCIYIYITGYSRDTFMHIHIFLTLMYLHYVIRVHTHILHKHVVAYAISIYKHAFVSAHTYTLHSFMMILGFEYTTYVIPKTNCSHLPSHTTKQAEKLVLSRNCHFCTILRFKFTYTCLKLCVCVCVYIYIYIYIYIYVHTYMLKTCHDW